MPRRRPRAGRQPTCPQQFKGGQKYSVKSSRNPGSSWSPGRAHPNARRDETGTEGAIQQGRKPTPEVPAQCGEPEQCPPSSAVMRNVISHQAFAAARAEFARSRALDRYRLGEDAEVGTLA